MILLFVAILAKMSPLKALFNNVKVAQGFFGIIVVSLGIASKHCELERSNFYIQFAEINQ